MPKSAHRLVAPGVVPLAAVALLTIQPARAADGPAGAAAADAGFEGQLSAGCELALAGSKKEARQSLDALEKALSSASAVVAPDVLGGLWFCRGVSAMKTGAKEAEALDHWRQALAIAPELGWDPALIDDADTQVVFEVLRKEVTSQSAENAGVPDATGAARVFIDGVKADPMTKVAGDYRHLGQVVCPDESVQTAWFDGDSPRRWLELCPGGVDTSVVVEEATDDDFGDMMPSFGPGPAASVPASTTVAASPPASAPATESPDASGGASKSRANDLANDLDEGETLDQPTPRALHVRGALGYPTLVGIEYGLGARQQFRVGVDAHSYGVWIVGGDVHLAWLFWRDQLGVELYGGPAYFMTTLADFDGYTYSNVGARARWSSTSLGLFALAGFGSIDGEGGNWWAPQGAVGWEW